MTEETDKKINEVIDHVLVQCTITGDKVKGWVYTGNFTEATEVLEKLTGREVDIGFASLHYAILNEENRIEITKERPPGDSYPCYYVNAGIQ